MEFAIIVILMVGAGALGSGASLFLSRNVIRTIRQDKSRIPCEPPYVKE
jgi:hypothetical protein